MPCLRPAAACALVFLLVANAQAERRAIVVLGAAIRPDGRPGPFAKRRLDTALRLARKDPEALVILVTGGRVVNDHTEGPAMARYLVARGFDPARILVESKAANTRENADFSVPLLRGAGVDRVTVVTEGFHLPRGMWQMRTALDEAGLGHVVVDGKEAPHRLGPEQLAQRLEKERASFVRDVRLRGKR
jgi:uncharacterized SAM-binding protein YcdF (DUF218 family)